MTIFFEERMSDSPYIEKVTQGYTVSDGAPIRPAEVCLHMVLNCLQTKYTQMFLRKKAAAWIAQRLRTPWRK